MNLARLGYQHQVQFEKVKPLLPPLYANMDEQDL